MKPSVSGFSAPRPKRKSPVPAESFLEKELSGVSAFAVPEPLEVAPKAALPARCREAEVKDRCGSNARRPAGRSLRRPPHPHSEPARRSLQRI